MARTFSGRRTAGSAVSERIARADGQRGAAGERDDAVGAENTPGVASPWMVSSRVIARERATGDDGAAVAACAGRAP